ncbi:hypothetical protein AT15_02375 [Kosmotoga arenicorallina S304]|uniref:ROK family protein n=1 Tax=Kosmotoga arenicorallina S304 TaxID=1453497 RepID=A0A182C7Q4_9BACT|nr:ROK family protein [Kosmotoga arenicorallina]OAA31693.1 hypothetical protein AT15_02375 [Kosmotoga arenicorallina S304]
MVRAKHNYKNLAKINRKLVLNLLRRESLTNRKALAKLSGLDPSTITKIIREFMNRNLCIETQPEISGKVGRRTIGLKLSKNAYKSVVVRVGVQVTEVAVGYFDGSIEHVDTVRSVNNIGKFVEKIRKTVYPIVEKIDPERFLGISISIPGMVDIENNYIIDVPHLGWRDVDLSEHLEGNIPIYIDNEANLSIIAEKWKNPLIKPTENVVFVYLSEGIGCGVIINGQIYRGTFFNAGELGHMTIDFNGKECYCGNRGCWETLASTEAIVREYERKIAKLEGSSYNDKFTSLISLSENNENALAFLKKEEAYLTAGITNIVNGLSPEYIILGGWGSILSDESVRRIENKVNSMVLHTAKNKIKIMKSLLDSKEQGLAAITGAALMIVDRSLENII